MLKILYPLLLCILLACEGTVARLLQAASRRAYRLAFAALAAVGVMTVAVLLLLGCSHQWEAAWDSSFNLGGAWYVFHGLRPHVDFYTHVGPLHFLIIALGMKVGGLHAGAMGLGYALLFPVLLLWGWALAKQRLSALNAALFAALAAFLLVGTRLLGTIGADFKTTTYAMGYNRLGWALLCLLLLELFLPPRETPSRRADAGNGASSGALLALLLFTKINYAGMAVAGLVLGGVLFRRSWSRTAALAVAFGAVTLAGLAYLRFDVAAIRHDIQMIGGVQTSSTRSDFGRFDPWATASTNVPWTGLLLVVAAVLTKPLVEAGADGAGRRGWWSLVLAALAAAGFGMAVCSANAQDKDIPLYALGALILCEGFRRRRLAESASATTSSGDRLRFLLCSLVAAHFALTILAADAASIGYSFAWKRLRAAQAPPSARIHSPTLEDMLLPPKENEVGRDHDQMVEAILRDSPDQFTYSPYRYAAWVNDGLGLLRPHVTAESRVFILDGYNPFPFALGLPPPRGAPLGYFPGWNFDEHHYIPSDDLFRDVTHVMVPKRPLWAVNPAFFLKLYGGALAREFASVGESRLWRLFARRAPSEH